MTACPFYRHNHSAEITALTCVKYALLCGRFFGLSAALSPAPRFFEVCHTSYLPFKIPIDWDFHLFVARNCSSAVRAASVLYWIFCLFQWARSSALKYIVKLCIWRRKSSRYFTCLIIFLVSRADSPLGICTIIRTSLHCSISALSAFCAYMPCSRILYCLCRASAGCAAECIYLI